MKAVCVTLDYADVTGGSAESVRQFETALDCQTISFTSTTLLGSAVRAPGVYHVPVEERGLGRLYARPGSAALRRAGEILAGADVLFCHKLFRFHNDWVCRESRRHGIPYCIVPHGSLDPHVFTYRRFRKALWMRSLGRKFFDHAAGLIFATQREKEKALARVSAARNWVVNWPVPARQSDGNAAARDETRARLGVAPEHRMLLFLGRLHPMKRPVETALAAATAGTERLRLVLAGPDDYYSRSELEAFLSQRGIANVRVAGPFYGPRKWDLYAAADGFINLSARENFGFTVAEALAAGRPVILSPGNDLISEVRSARCGWFLAEDSLDAASVAIREFAAASADTLKEMGTRGESWARENTSPERFQASLASVCREVVGHG